MKASVRVSNQPQVISVASNISSKISTAVDVDMTEADMGALLQYNSDTKTWVAKTSIDADGLVINCGNY